MAVKLWNLWCIQFFVYSYIQFSANYFQIYQNNCVYTAAIFRIIRGKIVKRF